MLSSILICPSWETFPSWARFLDFPHLIWQSKDSGYDCLFELLKLSWLDLTNWCCSLLQSDITQKKPQKRGGAVFNIVVTATPQVHFGSLKITPGAVIVVLMWLALTYNTIESGWHWNKRLLFLDPSWALTHRHWPPIWAESGGRDRRFLCSHLGPSSRRHWWLHPHLQTWGRQHEGIVPRLRHILEQTTTRDYWIHLTIIDTAPMIMSLCKMISCPTILFPHLAE